MKKLWSKRWFKIVSILLVLLIVFVLSLNSIFRGIGQWLNATDAPEQTDMCFVLGGNSYERGLEAYNLFQQFPQQSFIATDVFLFLTLLWMLIDAVVGFNQHTHTRSLSLCLSTSLLSFPFFPFHIKTLSPLILKSIEIQNSTYSLVLISKVTSIRKDLGRDMRQSELHLP